MRKSMSVAAIAALMMMGCSGSSSSSSSSGSTGTTTSTTTTTSTSGSSGSVSTTSTSGSSGSNTTSTSNSSSSSSGSTGATTATGSSSGSSGSTGSTGSSADLSCLGNEVVPTPTVTSANLTLVFKDGISGSKVTGATVNLCDATTVSTTCDATNRMSTGTTDSSGSVTLSVDLTNGAFFGFAELSGSTAALNTFVYLPPITQDLSQNVSTISTGDVGLAGTFLTGETVDTTTHGIVDGSVIDCSFNSITGATVTTDSTDATTRVNYFSGGFPSSSATATDASGNFLIVNAPVTDSLDVTYFSDATQTVPVADYIVQVAAGSVTTIIGPPND